MIFVQGKTLTPNQLKLAAHYESWAYSSLRTEMERVASPLRRPKDHFDRMVALLHVWDTVRLGAERAMRGAH